VGELINLFDSPIDKKRFHSHIQRRMTPLKSDDIWYIHSVFSQCFLPYKDPKTDTWERHNGDFSIALVAGHLKDLTTDKTLRRVGLPYGPKPRLFQSYICMKAIKHQSAIVPVEHCMTEMMRALGLEPTGGKFGNIRMFKEQIIRFAACHFTVIGPGPKGSYRHIKTPPIKRFDVFFPTDPRQGALWPSEILLTEDYYESLHDHAVPFDFRAMRPIQNKPRAQDIYLWLTQRCCRLPEDKPLLMRWIDLYEMFGGQTSMKDFKYKFPNDLKAAHMSYPDARIEQHHEGYVFRKSSPPIPKAHVTVP
jgi:hypothetical protein